MDHVETFLDEIGRVLKEAGIPSERTWHRIKVGNYTFSAIGGGRKQVILDGYTYSKTADPGRAASNLIYATRRRIRQEEEDRQRRLREMERRRVEEEAKRKREATERNVRILAGGNHVGTVTGFHGAMVDRAQPNEAGWDWLLHYGIDGGMCAIKFIAKDGVLARRAMDLLLLLARGTVTDGDALLRSVLQSPEDDTASLVYADWLEEMGLVERAVRLRELIEERRAQSYEPAESAAPVAD